MCSFFSIVQKVKVGFFFLFENKGEEVYLANKKNESTNFSYR